MRDVGFPGRLFIVEGIDGSGKSTQLDLLHKWLVSQGYLVVFTEWNSSPIVKATTRRGKKQRLLSPISFSLIHAADFANRIHAQILPALQAGAIVLADRYVYTAFARDAVRGVSRPWGRESFSAPTLHSRWVGSSGLPSGVSPLRRQRSSTESPSSGGGLVSSRTMSSASTSNSTRTNTSCRNVSRRNTSCLRLRASLRKKSKK